METRTFDELLNINNLRKLAARTVETYPLAWKVVHETLQNAKDAIRKSNKPGKVEITLDVENQSVTVKDSGSGFPRNEDLLGFGGTDKDTDSDWSLNGKQGVGLKAVILSTKIFTIEATHEGERWTLEITDADKFIDGGNPSFSISDSTPVSEPSGTTVRYYFRESLVSEFLSEVLNQQLSNVTDYLATGASPRIGLALESYFRSFSYAGDANVLLGLNSPTPVEIEIKVNGTKSPTGVLPTELLGEIKAGSIQCRFPSGLWNVKEAIDRTGRGRPRPTVLSQALPPGGSLGRYNENFVYVNSFTTIDDYKQLLENPNLRRGIDASKYQRLFEQLRGVYVAIGSRTILKQYLIGDPRQFIAADGTPTAHVLPGPTRGGDASYVSNNIHFVANIDAKLNYGKQTVSNTRLVGMVADYFADVVRATLRNVAISIVGRSGSSSSADDIEDSSDTETDVLSRPTLANELLNFRRIPRDENALIAIFFELVGNGSLEGYHFYSLSQKARYDGRASIKLSYMSDVPVPAVDNDLRNVEFKLEVRDVIDDFETEIKFPGEIQLIVVWDDTISANVTDYQVLDIDYTDDADRRMDGVEKVLHCKRHGRMIQLLVLSDFVARNDGNGGSKSD